MWYENNSQEWLERDKPVAQIERNGISGKYTVWLYHLIASGGEKTITKGALVLINNLYNPGVGGSIPPAVFDTEQCAIDAYNDYRKRNPLNPPPRNQQHLPEKESEVIKTLFE